jgi:hypothetical protein
VLVHGHHGSPEDHTALKGHLLVEFAARSRRVQVLVSSRNHGRTNEGIAEGGRNLAEEIVACVAMMPPAVGRIKLCIVAHSLGGLYARAALPAVFRTAVVADRVEPVSFVTVSTPHLGSKRPMFAHAVGTDMYLWLSGRTGEDLAQRSDALQTLCNAEHLAALARF